MKSVKAFLLLMLALYICLFGFDYLKAEVFPSTSRYHSWMIWLKTFFLVTAGTGIMYLTLERGVFKTFFKIYLILWIIYFLIKWISKVPIQLSLPYLKGEKVMLFYMNITQILTPFPFFFFWVLNRVFSSDMLRDMTGKKEAGK